MIGSVARGDVRPSSDVDVVVLSPPSSSLIEEAIIAHGFEIVKREIVMATPLSPVKGIIHLTDKASITLILSKPTRLDLEFLRFAGSVGREEIGKGVRVPGVNKQLRLIRPTPRGHLETAIVGREFEVARFLGISVELVRERVRALSERRGRGVFISREVPPDESIESFAWKLASQVPAIRRRLLC